MRALKTLFLSLLVMGLPALRADAHIELVTLPPRDTVQLTIYNGADLTLVRERRSLTLQKGENSLQFSWAGTLIDPTSVELRPMSHTDRVEVLDTTFPANLPSNLVWHIASQVEGDVQVEITYFTSGISWSADYVVEAAPDETAMTLSGYVTVHNRSGEDYANAETRLVVGRINLVEEIADLARRGIMMQQLMRKAVADMEMVEEARVAGFAARAPAAPKEIIKEGLSEYFLYTVEGRETILDQWSKRLRSFRAKDVPLETEYRFDPRKFGADAHVFFTVKNSEKNHLGKEPLPNGRVMAFRRLNGDGRLTFAGQSTVSYIPIDEDIEVDLGRAPDVTLEAMRMAYHTEDFRFNANGNVIGHDQLETFRLRVRNGRPRATKWEIRQYHSGEWTWKPVDNAKGIERENIGTILVKRVIPAGEQVDIEYLVTTTIGQGRPKPVN